MDIIRDAFGPHTAAILLVSILLGYLIDRLFTRSK